jgi:tetratricopeptide (TPR) repeat protein
MLLTKTLTATYTISSKSNPIPMLSYTSKILMFLILLRLINPSASLANSENKLSSCTTLQKYYNSLNWEEETIFRGFERREITVHLDKMGAFCTGGYIFQKSPLGILVCRGYMLLRPGSVVWSHGSGNEINRKSDYCRWGTEDQFQEAKFSLQKETQQQEEIKGQHRLILELEQKGDYIKIAELKEKQKDLRGALAAYDKAIALSPKSAFAYSGRSIVKAEQNDFAGAISDLNQAIKIDSNSPFLYHNRASMKQENGDKNGAIQDFQEAAQLYRKRGLTGNLAKVIKSLKMLGVIE